MKQTLFISHDSSLSGAPRVLYLFLKWIRLHHPEISRHLLMLRGGSMENIFRQESEIAASTDQGVKQNRGVLERVKRFISNNELPGIPHSIASEARQNGYPVVYANTVASLAHGVHVCKLSSVKSKFILHVHEMDSMIGIVQPRFDELHGRVDHFIAASELVKKQLVSKRGVPANKITVVYEFSEIPNGIVPSTGTSSTFEVCAAGTVEHRKGYDLFIEVARQVMAREPNAAIKFTWVGSISDELRATVDSVLSVNGLSDVVRFTGESDNAPKFIANSDLFLLPSREDPFPLVCIEAGMLGKPVICFADATGINEVIRNGGGVNVPFGNVEAMADTVLRYYHNRDLAKADGKRAKELFSSFTPEIQCKQLFGLLNE